MINNNDNNEFNYCCSPTNIISCSATNIISCSATNIIIIIIINNKINLNPNVTRLEERRYR